MEKIFSIYWDYFSWGYFQVCSSSAEREHILTSLSCLLVFFLCFLCFFCFFSFFFFFFKPTSESDCWNLPNILQCTQKTHLYISCGLPSRDFYWYWGISTGTGAFLLVPGHFYWYRGSSMHFVFHRTTYINFSISSLNNSGSRCSKFKSYRGTNKVFYETTKLMLIF